MEANQRHGRDLFHRCVVNKSNYYRDTPLLMACSGGSTDVVEVLLKAGANVNVTDRRGNTPLNRAVKNSQKNLKTIKVLLEYGADINIRNRDRRMDINSGRLLIIGSSPLDNAIYELPVAKLLLKMYILKNVDNCKRIFLEPYIESSNYGKLVQYFDDCVSEIIQMKTEIVYHQISLHDLMTKVAIDLSGNNVWVKKMKDVMTKRYPVYHDIIAEKIELCITRWRLLNKSRELKFFTVIETSVGGKTIMLDPDSVRIIASNLSMKDLLNFMSALSKSCNYNFFSSSQKLSNLEKESTLTPNSFTTCPNQAPSHSVKQAKLD
ncbi:Ankyrin repeat and KH domain-containing protein mask [Gryllus bimaculatus]|nr:Ankyrin repeat and KH domain-containing protein mask [Gryllus bimaculatus]